MKKVNRLKLMEYRRRVFNTCLLECLNRIHAQTLDMNPHGDTHEQRLCEMATRMCNVFFTDELHLNTSTITQTKQNLSEAITFIQDCIGVCEAIAQDKMDIAEKEDIEVDDDQDIELSEEDEALLDKVFDEKSPEVQVDQIRDATVKALIEEDKKAQDVRNSLSIAQSQVATDGDAAALEETVNRLNSRGPTSLMNAILNAMSIAAVKDVNENSNQPVVVGAVMHENAEEIRSRACMVYTLYEMSNVLGIHTWTPLEVKREAEKIYYGK